MYQASVEEHVPPAIEDFTLIMFELFSQCFSAEILKLRLLGDGAGETGAISTPKCSFQSAFLHVDTHLNDPSFADNSCRKNVIVTLCKYIQRNITNIHELWCIAECEFDVL